MLHVMFNLSCPSRPTHPNWAIRWYTVSPELRTINYWHARLDRDTWVSQGLARFNMYKYFLPTLSRSHCASHENAPVVCSDEKPVQLISEKKTPLPVNPGHPALYDYEYLREGTRNLFGFFEPKAGWRHIAVTTRRTKDDFCEQMRYLVEDCYPNARIIHVVLDNLIPTVPTISTKSSKLFMPEPLQRNSSFTSRRNMPVG